MAYPHCPICNGKMKKAKTRPGCSASLMALSLTLLGLGLCLTCIGAILGIPMIAWANRMVQTEKIWRCSNCRHSLARA